jgi:hypothetical protein
VTLATDEASLATLIQFPQNIRQVKGVQYAIVVNYQNAPPSGADQWMGMWNGAMGRLGGGEMFSGPDGKIWSVSDPNGHEHFRTYVIPD